MASEVREVLFCDEIKNRGANCTSVFRRNILKMKHRIVYLLCFLFAAIQYSKSGKTSVPLAYGLNIFCVTAGFLMQPFCERILCYCITAMARGAYQLDIVLIIWPI